MRVAAATVAAPAATRAVPEASQWPYPRVKPHGTESAVEIIRGRRSAQRFDRKFTLPAAQFFRLLTALLPRPGLPWDLWHHAARVHPLLFVNRVEGLAPGLYMLTPPAPRRSLASRRAAQGVSVAAG
ncbi:MAG: hypothetical protein WDO56_24815 [Gammaproteobacteria bacterium]